jgi:hypothetical protein
MAPEVPFRRFFHDALTVFISGKNFARFMLIWSRRTLTVGEVCRKAAMPELA